MTTLKSDLQQFQKPAKLKQLSLAGLGLAFGFALVPGLNLKPDDGLLLGTIILGTITLYLLIRRP